MPSITHDRFNSITLLSLRLCGTDDSSVTYIFYNIDKMFWNRKYGEFVDLIKNNTAFNLKAVLI